MSQNPYDPPKGSSNIQSGAPNERPIKASRFETLEFVASALRMLAAVTDKKGEHSAPDFCQMVLQLAFDISNSDSSQTEAFLRELKLTRSEDVGDAIYELIDRGYAQANEKDQRSDFDNLYDLSCPQQEWKVFWIEAPN